MDERSKLLAALLAQFPGSQPQPAPFYQESRPYQSINDYGAAAGRDGGFPGLMGLFGAELPPERRVSAGWYDALPMQHWGRGK
jgi:hypothetical protein